MQENGNLVAVDYQVGWAHSVERTCRAAKDSQIDSLIVTEWDRWRRMRGRTRPDLEETMENRRLR